MPKYSKISDYKIKKVLKCFTNDLTAKDAAKELGLNRNTINRYYKIFRTRLLASMFIDNDFGNKHFLQEENFPFFNILCPNGQIYINFIPDPEELRKIYYLLNNGDFCCALYNDSYSNKRFLLKNYTLCAGKLITNSKIIGEFWGFTKNRLIKFCGLNKENFYFHLKESEFRFNHRKDLYKIMSELVNETKNN